MNPRSQVRMCGVIGVIVTSLFFSTSTKAQGGGDNKTVIINNNPSPYFGYIENPYAGILRGTAAVIEAQGDYLLAQQQAKILNQKYQQAKLDTRRKTIEQWVWERDYLAQDVIRQRKLVKERELERNRVEPALPEVLSGRALNVLLDALKEAPGALPGMSVPVRSDWLRHVHSSCASGGNVGLFKEDKLPWPMYLRRSSFDKDRARIDDLFSTVKKQLLAGQLEPASFDALAKSLTGLDQKLTGMIQNNQFDVSYTTIIGARRQVRQVQDVLLTLESETEGAVYYLKPLQGQSVAEVVRYMKDHGLRFAPATNGSERHYVAMRQALADEVTRLGGMPNLIKPAKGND